MRSVHERDDRSCHGAHEVLLGVGFSCKFQKFISNQFLVLVLKKCNTIFKI